MKRLTVGFTVILLSLAAFAYSDIPAGHWAKSAVEEASKAGLIQGFPDGTFRGNEYVTRYQLAVVLSKLLKVINEARSYPSLAGEANQLKDATELLQKMVALTNKVATLEAAKADSEEVQALEQKVGDLAEQVAQLESLLQTLRNASAEGGITQDNLAAIVESVKSLAQQTDQLDLENGRIQEALRTLEDKQKGLYDLVVLTYGELQKTREDVASFAKVLASYPTRAEVEDALKSYAQQIEKLVGDRLAAVEKQQVEESNRISKLEKAFDGNQEILSSVPIKSFGVRAYLPYGSDAPLRTNLFMRDRSNPGITTSLKVGRGDGVTVSARLGTSFSVEHVELSYAEGRLEAGQVTPSFSRFLYAGGVYPANAVWYQGALGTAFYASDGASAGLLNVGPVSIGYGNNMALFSVHTDLSAINLDGEAFFDLNNNQPYGYLLAAWPNEFNGDRAFPDALSANVRYFPGVTSTRFSLQGTPPFLLPQTGAATVLRGHLGPIVGSFIGDYYQNPVDHLYLNAFAGYDFGPVAIGPTYKLARVGGTNQGSIVSGDGAEHLAGVGLRTELDFSGLQGYAELLYFGTFQPEVRLHYNGDLGPIKAEAALRYDQGLKAGARAKAEFGIFNPYAGGAYAQRAGLTEYVYLGGLEVSYEGFSVSADYRNYTGTGLFGTAAPTYDPLDLDQPYLFGNGSGNGTLTGIGITAKHNDLVFEGLMLKDQANTPYQLFSLYYSFTY